MKNSDLETGTVIKAEGKWATVITNKSTACNECGKAQAGICGKGGAGIVVQVLNQLGAGEGETVELGLDKKVLIMGYFFFFIFPVVMLFISVYAGEVISQKTGVTGLDVIAGFTGLVISIIYSLKKVRSLERSSYLSITKIFTEPYKPGTIPSPEEADYLRAFNRP